MKNRVDKTKAVSRKKAKPEQIESLTFYVTASTAARVRRAAKSRDQTLNKFGMHSLIDDAHLYEADGMWENLKTGEARYFDDYILPPGGAKALEREFRKEGFTKVKLGPESPSWTDDVDPSEVCLGNGKTTPPTFSQLLKELASVRETYSDLIPYLHAARQSLKYIKEGHSESATIKFDVEEPIRDEFAALAELLGFSTEEAVSAILMKAIDKNAIEKGNTEHKFYVTAGKAVTA